MTVSNATGRSATPRFADAFGNTLTAWDSGLWAEDSGWGHNTNETDGDLDSFIVRTIGYSILNLAWDNNTQSSCVFRRVQHCTIGGNVFGRNSNSSS